MFGFDQTLFLAINAPAEPPRLVLLGAIVCAKYLFLLVPLHMLVVWAGGTRVMRATAITGVLAMAATLILSGLIGAIHFTPRPFLLGLGHALIEHRPSASFPSNHAIVCFSWACMLAIHRRGALAAATATLGLLVAWSRVYLGIHFPLDMAGAALLSGGVALAVARLTLIDGGRALTRLDDAVGALAPVRALRRP